MSHYGLLSLLPPVLAIALAIRTKQVYVSLMAGIWLGWLILSDGRPVEGSMAAIQALVDVFKDEGNTRTIMFCALVGALVVFIQRSGGVEGFIMWVQRRLSDEKTATERSRRKIMFFAWLTGLLVFVESSISALTVGSLFRPLFDKERISREKLAFLADSSSAPSCILIPFNAWGAFIMGLLVTEGIADPFATLMSTIPYNFYPFLALGLALWVALSGKDIGPMKAAEHRVRTTNQLLNPGSQPMISEDLTELETKPGVRPRAINMVVPLTVMVLMMPLMLCYTGWSAAIEAQPDAGIGRQLLYAIGQGSGSTSVLWAVIIALFSGSLLYGSQRMFSLSEWMNLLIKGISGLMPLALLMMFAFALVTVCKSLGTGLYVAETTSAWLSPGFVPVIVFLVSCFIAFSTGTSWGTFAIILTIAIPMAREMGAPMLMTIGAALSGGVFGDHCSPISDTTIISSMSAATDHMDHVKTQLPYALIAGSLSAMLYTISGWWSS